MRRSLSLATLVIAVLATLAPLAACKDDTTAPAPHPATSEPPGMSSGDPGVTPPGPGTGDPVKPPPPEPEWVAPVVATTSAACGTPHADAVHANFTTPGGRTYHVWGPSGYDPSKTYPVVMVFHGIETNGADFESWFKMEDYTKNEAFVVYPDAAGPNAYWDVNGTTDLVFFDQMVKQLGETFCINPSRLLAFGFSYGGHFVDRLGCARAGYVKAIMVGDGGPGPAGPHCGRLPVLVTTRTKDTNEYPAYGKNVQTEWTALDKCGSPGAPAPQVNSNNGEDMGWCVTHASCKAPGSLMYCEDTSSFGPNDPPDWNHTVREYYRAFAYNWFKALP